MGRISIKTDKEIEKMREACRRAAWVLTKVKAAVCEGVSTYDIDQLAKSAMDECEVTSTSYGYVSGSRRFPGYICISINEQVVHGIGVKEKILHQGDIVSLDVAVRYDGFVGDNATTVMLDPVEPRIRNLVDVTEQALYKGIDQAREGKRVGDISFAVQNFAESNGYSVVRELVGHGIGREMHEEPQVPNFGPANIGPKLKAGMTLAIEPMVNMGARDVVTAKDGWTIVTKDRKPCAHFEHTVLITKDEPEILTIV